MTSDMPPTGQDLAGQLQRGRHIRGFLLFGGWGAAAALSLGVAAVVARTMPGGDFPQRALVVNEPAADAVPTFDEAGAANLAEAQRRAALAEARTERMAAQLRALSTDRDRLAARLASLEDKLEGITGSIKSQMAAAPSTGMPANRAAPMSSITPGRTAEAAMRSAPARQAPIAEIGLAPIRLPPSVQAMPSPQIATPLTMSLAAAGGPGWPLDAAKTAGRSAAKARAAKPVETNRAPPQTKPPDAPSHRNVEAPARTKRAEEPSRTKKVEAVTAVASVPVPPKPIPVTRAPPSEIGVDLGRAETLDTVHAQWAAVKANFGPMLTGLRPVPARDSRTGHGPYRLVIGALPSRRAAARLCARFAIGHVYCRPVEFSGQRIVQR